MPQRLLELLPFSVPVLMYFVVSYMCANSQITDLKTIRAKIRTKLIKIVFYEIYKFCKVFLLTLRVFVGQSEIIPPVASHSLGADRSTHRVSVNTDHLHISFLVHLRLEQSFEQKLLYSIS